MSVEQIGPMRAGSFMIVQKKIPHNTNQPLRGLCFQPCYQKHLPTPLAITNQIHATEIPQTAIGMDVTKTRNGLENGPENGPENGLGFHALDTASTPSHILA